MNSETPTHVPAQGTSIATVSTSYFGEFDTDRHLRDRFFPGETTGVMVEVGAATPEYLSLSQHFRLSGWRCIGIEPNPNFAEMHRARGHEVYQVACGEEDKDGVPFEVVHAGGSGEHAITDHSFSALSVKEGYKKHSPYFHNLRTEKITVNVRRLDTILAEAGIERIDLLAIDVEGWELEVMRGLSVDRYRPRVVVLENYLHDPAYAAFMAGLGYEAQFRVEYNYCFARKAQ